ncbi:hypothetical protein R1flu_003606 [Riccia fluitans]|uniref:Uncharacterized protein n=1 Tax=Riccia fluitans TaxID=41844 RepID=A0ABD1Y9U2_9MARC
MNVLETWSSKRIPSILSVAVSSCKCGVTIAYEIYALCRVGEFDIQHFSCIRTVFAYQESPVITSEILLQRHVDEDFRLENLSKPRTRDPRSPQVQISGQSSLIKK